MYFVLFYLSSLHILATLPTHDSDKPTKLSSKTTKDPAPRVRARPASVKISSSASGVKKTKDTARSASARPDKVAKSDKTRSLSKYHDNF